MSREGAGVTQALSFLEKEVSPNLRLALVTKAFLSPPPAVSPSLREAARPCLPRLLLPSATSGWLALLTPSSWLGAHMVSTAFPLLAPWPSSSWSSVTDLGSQQWRSFLQQIFVGCRLDARLWGTLGPNKEVTLPLWSCLVGQSDERLMNRPSERGVLGAQWTRVVVESQAWQTFL